MPRNLPHLLIKNPQVQNKSYQGRQGFPSDSPSPIADRAAHANALLSALAQLPNIAQQGLPGVYLRVDGRPNEPMLTDSLGKSGLTLLQVKEAKGENEGQNFKQALVFASQNGLQALRGKITQYREQNNVNKQTGEPTGPKNAPLVDSMSSLRQAALQDLWNSQQPLPEDSTDAVWEIWLRREAADDFFREDSAQKFCIRDRLEFPDDIVVIGIGGHKQLYDAIVKSGAVRSLAPVATPAFFLEDSTVEDNQAWQDNLSKRTCICGVTADTSYAAIMDYGIERSHPLIQPALNAGDRYAAEPAWGVETGKSHGTKMAGLVLYGDLMQALQSPSPITLSHRLESIKILPESAIGTPHHLYGHVTMNGIKAAENGVKAAKTGDASRLRTYIMAATTDEDTPHDGAPTSWSAALDSLASGSETLYANNTVNDTRFIADKRLIAVAGGNVAEGDHNPPSRDYFQYCDAAEIESPAQAWNVITVGAYTEKTCPSPQSLAPAGDLSPASRTASWDSYWPIKPDVVMEGGNYVVYGGKPPYVSKDDKVSLLTTAHNYPSAVFSAFGQTSAATALAGKALAELRSEYPHFWPETIRALFVGSARWTEQMKSRLNGSRNKGDLKRLSKRYGYGVPNIQRTKHSANNDCTLIIQDSITPYDLSAWKNGQYTFGDLKLYKLPWPQTLLSGLGNAEIEIRVTLSTFAIPNPARSETGNKYQYASHGLRFDLIRVNETLESFISRVSNDRETNENSTHAIAADWEFGSRQRDVGSIQVDWIKGRASDFAQRNYLAVYPVQGWWRFKRAQENEDREARFALTVEINAENCASADIYAEVQNKIQMSTPIAAAS